MLLNLSVATIQSLPFRLLVCISLMFGISHALQGKPCVFKLTLKNLRTVLSWEFKNYSIVPAYYNVQYTIMSKLEATKTIETCTNITSTFCDVTELWQDFHEHYFVLVEGFQGAVSVNCSDTFMPLEQYVEPPEFEITDFTDHINVTVKFPSNVPESLRDKLEHYLPLVISEETGGIVKTHKSRIPKNISGNITYVIEKLIPKSNYCVSVYFEPILLTNVIKPPPKCTFLPPDQEPESTDSAKMGGIIVMSLIAMVIMSTTATLKRAGCICLKSNLPKALNFHNFFGWIFPDLPPSEAMDTVEVICINRKKKVWDYNYDDESDSDNETAPRGNAGGYTMHGLLGRPLTQASASPAASEGSQSSDLGTRESDVEELNSPEAHAEPPTSPRWDSCPSPPECTSERPEGWTTDPFPDGDSCSPVGSVDRTAFNVDLKSVFMRLVDEDPEEAPGRLSPLPEDISDLEGHSNLEPSLLMSSAEALTLPNPSTCSECQWPEDTPSEESGTSDSDSDSDVAAGGGYIRR